MITSYDDNQTGQGCFEIPSRLVSDWRTLSRFVQVIWCQTMHGVWYVCCVRNFGNNTCNTPDYKEKRTSNDKYSTAAPRQLPINMWPRVAIHANHMHQQDRRTSYMILYMRRGIILQCSINGASSLQFAKYFYDHFKIWLFSQDIMWCVVTIVVGVMLICFYPEFF